MRHLFLSKRFLPLFSTQFWGAFNDNLFKNALVILVAYKIAVNDSAYSALIVNLAFGLFILPTLLFSYLAGQLSDKVDRARIIRWIKAAEIMLAVVGGVGLYLNNLPLLLVALFGFGTHSAFFGPVKYAILPEHLRETELIGANAYIEAGTFLAILGGTLFGGVLILMARGALLVALFMVAVAVLGYLSSRMIPSAPAPVPDMKLAFNPLRETIRMICFSSRRREEFLIILGISWFWFIGALFLAQFSPFAKDVLHADEHVVTLFLMAFSVGIALGSLLCARLIKGLVRATYAPVSALGMSAFALDLYFTTRHAIVVAGGGLLSVTGFLQQAFGRHVLFDLVGLSVCAGLYIVPLYALLQVRAGPEHGGRSIAANNLMNALFMVVAAGMAIAFIKLGMSIPQIFLAVAILNLLAAVYITRLLPFSLISILLKLLYRVEVRGLENWQKAGERVLVVANHSAFLDAAVLAAFLPGRVGFAVNTFIARRWWLRPLLKLVDVYLIDPGNPIAAKTLIDELKRDKKIMIFPEGRLTTTGALMKVYDGPGMIADKSDAMLLPVRIDGTQYSPTSKLQGKVRIRLFPKVVLTFLPPRKLELPAEIRGRKRRQLAGAQLYTLMSQMLFDSSPVHSTLMENLLDACATHGGSHVIAEDPRREPMDYRRLIAGSFVLGSMIAHAVAKEERHIALMLPNMTAAAVAFFAVQSLGRVSVMLNFTAGAGQVLLACQAATIKTVVTSRQFVEAGKQEPVIEALQSAGIRMLYLEDLRAAIGLPQKLYGVLAGFVPRWLFAIACKAHPDDAAVILFTSGSEGTPKGVVLSSRNILSNRYQIASRVDFGPQDTVFNCLPMFHAFGLTGATLLPMLSGAKVFFYPSPLHYRIVPELAYDSNATILFGTDTFLAGYARFANPYDFHSLRYVFAGAEKLKDSTQRAWFDKFGLRIFEGYGITETAPVLSVNTAMHYRAGTVGRFLPNIEVKLQPVAGIETGQQLWVKGPNIMLGYMKNDAPGRLQPVEGGWYDTGDIVTVDAEGFVTVQGRTKRFAKVAGEMISLAAIEAVVDAAWPGVNHAIVSVPDPRKGEMLVLLTEHPAAELGILPEVFRRHGLTALSLPGRLIRLDKLPLLGSGKVDYVTARRLTLEDFAGAGANPPGS